MEWTENLTCELRKFRHRRLGYRVIRRHLGEVFHELAKQKESRMEERYFHEALEAALRGNIRISPQP
jgi:hypothetical protein